MTAFVTAKKANDILVDDIISIKTMEILISENDTLATSSQENIYEEYNVDVSELDISFINQEINAYVDYIYEDFFKAERMKTEILFFEIENNKYALQYKINFHIYQTEGEHWNSDFRHFIVYLN